MGDGVGGVTNGGYARPERPGRAEADADVRTGVSTGVGTGTGAGAEGDAGVVARPRRTGAGGPEWFVSLTLPIEAGSPAEAVHEFWSYVDKLGSAQLPAFVWPRGRELDMQAYVLDTRVNLDPEEDAD